MLDRLSPKKIIIVSSAPQIRFPDCYGIDMSKMKEFVAFRALLELLKESNQSDKLETVYNKCKTALKKSEVTVNHINELYDLFSYEEVSDKIAKIMTPLDLKSDFEVVYQTIDNLHKACPNHLGDWYFTGEYPTLGGNRVVNQAFINFYEGSSKRAY
jgi:amidophosphoribosyltransferase